MVHSLSFLTPFFLAASTLAASVQKPDLALPSYADAVKAEVADIFNASYNAYKQAPFYLFCRSSQLTCNPRLTGSTPLVTTTYALYQLGPIKRHLAIAGMGLLLNSFLSSCTL